MAQMDLVVVWGAAPELRFEVEERAVEVRACISDKFGFGGVEDDNFIFQRCQELGGPAAH
jgi:hypothetical protein